MVQVLAAAISQDHSFTDVVPELVHREAPFIQNDIELRQAEVSGVFYISLSIKPDTGSNHINW